MFINLAFKFFSNMTVCSSFILTGFIAGITCMKWMNHGWSQHLCVCHRAENLLPVALHRGYSRFVVISESL